MSDIFAPLREPEPSSPLAPEEVRRRGDRLRRRRAALVVASAAATTAVIVAATFLMVGDPLSRVSPDPIEPPTRQAIVPEEFDLADGLPREVTGTVGAHPPLVICGESFPLTDRAIASQGITSNAQGDLTVRGLSLYPDAATAQSVASDLVAGFDDCQRSRDLRGRRAAPNVSPTTHGDQGWMATTSVRPSGTGVDVPEVTHVVRVGASLLITQGREIHGISLEALIRGTNDQVTWLMDRQMCLLTEEGCAWRSDPDILRPDGWGPLDLGMSRQELEASGVTEFNDTGECTTLEIGAGSGALSESDELVSIQVPEGVTTPAGIGPGSSREEAREAYWVAASEGDTMSVRASPVSDYEITFERGRVTQLKLAMIEEECSR